MHGRIEFTYEISKFSITYESYNAPAMTALRAAPTEGRRLGFSLEISIKK